MTTAPVPPQNLEAEEHVLGASMLSPGAADVVLTSLRPEMFYRETHRGILLAIAELREKGVAADPVALRAQLQDEKAREIVGLLVELCPTVGNVQHHCELVRDVWLKREVLRGVSRVAEFAADGVPGDEALEALELTALDLRHTAESGKPASRWTMGQAMAELQAELDSPPEDAAGVPTPWERLKPVRRGQVTVVCGYSGDGKSAACEQIFLHAIKGGHRARYFTLEMPKRQCRDRMLAKFGVPYGMIEKRRVLGAARVVLQDAMRSMEKWPGEIVDDCRNPAAIRRAVRVSRPEIIFIDHLHRIQWRERRELENYVMEITDLAVQEDIAIVLAAQLHRPPQSDNFSRPTMLSLRDTGVIENEAAAVWAVYRHRTDNVRENDTSLLVLKDRFGRENEFRLTFEGPFMRFSDPPGPPLVEVDAA